MLKKTLSPAAIHATHPNGEQLAPSSGLGNGIAVKNAGRHQENTWHRVSVTAATSKPFRITEKEFSKQVEDLLNMFHWRWCHFRPARTEHGWRTALSGYPGFPDYIAVKGDRLIIFELKSDKGKISQDQIEWLDALKNINIELYLWRPGDIEGIAEILRQPLACAVSKGW